MRLPSELKNEGFESFFNPISLAPSAATTSSSTPFSATTGGAAAAGAEAAAETDDAAAAADGKPEEGLLDHLAATICATPMLLQFLRALMLSWRTKLGGNLRIIEDIGPSPVNDDDMPAVESKRRRDEPGMEVAEKFVGLWNDKTAISLSLFCSFSLSLYGVWVRCVRDFSLDGFLRSQTACRFAFP